MYAKLIEGVLEYAPDMFKDGNKTIFNFNLNEQLMKEYGYKKVVENIPVLANNQYLEFDNYKEGFDSIIVNYRVVDIDSQHIDDDLVSRISLVEQDIDDIKTQQAEIQAFIVSERNKEVL